jgi:hypothetical protein
MDIDSLINRRAAQLKAEREAKHSPRTKQKKDRASALEREIAYLHPEGEVPLIPIYSAHTTNWIPEGITLFVQRLTCVNCAEVYIVPSPKILYFYRHAKIITTTWQTSERFHPLSAYANLPRTISEVPGTLHVCPACFPTAQLPSSAPQVSKVPHLDFEEKEPSHA